MGQLMQYRCNCGYSEELTVGGGLLANRETTVRGEFFDHEIDAFEQAKTGGSLTRFFVEYEPALCLNCRELMALPVLHYWEGIREHVLRKSCPDCGGAILPQEDEAADCPKCGRRMDAAETGLWD